MKKILLSSLFILFLTGAWAQTATLYVDNDFDQNTPGWGVTHFDKIQDAIDAATSTWTIDVKVASGTYTLTQPLLIDKNNLTLKNMEGARPIIKPCSIDCPIDEQLPPEGEKLPEGRGKFSELFVLGLIYINADDVTLKGFKIESISFIDVFINPEEKITPFFVAGVYAGHSNFTIEDNIIVDSDIGVFVGGTFYFDRVQSTQQFQIFDNIITDNYFGVWVDLFNTAKGPAPYDININMNGNSIIGNDLIGIYVTEIDYNGYGNKNGGGFQQVKIFINENDISGYGDELDDEIFIPGHGQLDESAALFNNTNEDIDASCNWWGYTDVNKIEEQIENVGSGQVNYFPFFATEAGPCLQQLFKLQIGTRD